MKVRIVRPAGGGVVKAIASKSEAHRMLICAALADRETVVGCEERSEDIEATASCLALMGASVKYVGGEYLVSPITESPGVRGKSLGYSGFGAGTSDNEHSLDCGESGSTLRFLLPVCGALGIRAAFHMSGRLPERPMGELSSQLEAGGCILSEQGSNPLRCSGQLRSGIYTIPGNVSSQFVSGLLFALSLLEGESSIYITGVLESRPYVDITLDALRLFGVSVFEELGVGGELGVRSEELGVKDEDGLVFRVSGGQAYRSPEYVRAGGDWSNAAFWLSLGAIGKGGVTCTGLDMESRQGDRRIVELLGRFGAIVTCENDAVNVSPSLLRGIDIDARDTPDLVPVLAAVASVAEGKTVIRNAERLRIKESNRLSAITQALGSLGADIAETEDGLVIFGKKTLSGGGTGSFGDHRIPMASAVASAACIGPVVIEGAEAVRKSYPGFFDDFCTALGGEIIVEN